MVDTSDLYQRLRSGDEPAFNLLVRQLHRSMVGVAMRFVGNRATADEVVQDTWVAVIEGLDGFEERSSLKNWIFAILTNKARTRAVRDRRMVTTADLTREIDDETPVVDPSRFDTSGAWRDFPNSWDDVTPERIVAGRQMWTHVQEAIDRLPPIQRSVLVLREIEQMDAHAVSTLLEISDGNQRVLLHRARARVREMIEQVLGK